MADTETRPEQELQPHEEEAPQQAPEGEEEEVKEKPAAEPTEKEPESKADEEEPAVLPSEENQEEEVKGETAAPSPPRRHKVRTTDPSDGVDLAMGAKGIEAIPPITVGRMFQETVGKFPSHPALRYKEEGEWKTITYEEYYQLCIKASKSFLKLGLEPYHAVAIIGFNSPEWLISNLGAMFAGGLAAGIYTTNNPEACYFIANDCKANIVVVENQKQLDKILEVRDRLQHLKAIVQYKGKLGEQYPNVYEWEEFLKLGDEVETSVVEEKIKSQRPEQCALLIYTSGTTGDPKGVMLSHDNLTWTVKSLHTTYLLGTATDHIVSYLPLSHIAAQVADIYLPIVCAATVSFAQPDALKGSLVQTLREAQPTLFFGVPRVWEKLKEAMQAAGASVTGFKRMIADWAKGKGLQGNRNIQNKQPLPWGWTIANLLIFKKVRERLGFTRCNLMIVGAAPIHRSVLEYFMSVNMPILELFGMSENSGPQSFNRMDNWRLGSVGQPMLGTQVKIDSPDEKGEGEILLYGRHVFMGYLNNEEKTMEAIDDEGWVHSGDIGRIDQDGFLYITGRIKEIIITSGGENMAPVPIEDAIKEEVPFLSNVMIIGDKKKYVTCLVTLKCVMDPDTGEPQDELLPQAKQAVADLGSQCTKVSEIVEQKDKAVFTAIQDGLDRANEHAVSRAQRVQKFTLLDKDFSMPGGELGPTLKLKRMVVVKKYADKIDAMYDEEIAQ